MPISLIRRLRAPRAMSRYEHLLRTVTEANPASLLEIGVWRGDRSVQFLQAAPNLVDYVGADLFEQMDSPTFTHESMGNCLPKSMAEVESRLLASRSNPNTQIRLVRGRSDVTLPQLAAERSGRFDFIYIDGGHSLETVANDWEWSRQLIRPGGTVVFDDYYPNDATRGAKVTIDALLRDQRYRVRFFPVIEDIVEDLQITMVKVLVHATTSPSR